MAHELTTAEFMKEVNSTEKNEVLIPVSSVDTYTDLPFKDLELVEGSPIVLFNRKNNEAKSLDEAYKNRGDKFKPLSLDIIGYEIGERHFEFTDQKTKEIRRKVSNVLYCYLKDGSIVFMHSATALRPLFEFMAMFGTPSKPANGRSAVGITVEIGQESYNGKSRYTVNFPPEQSDIKA